MQVPRPTLEVLEHTRRGEPVDPAEIAALVNAWSMGSASDAQMSAWCATAGIQGASLDVAVELAAALLAGGDRLELASLGPTADIRSTGGVGDSALVFAASALAASLGVLVASTGTRGLSRTGGILDALEAIPGMRPELSLEEYVRQLREVGVVIAEPGERLVPAERRLADLRESTGTADGDVLVAVAAAARGISGGAANLVVEVPGGAGSLLPDLAHADLAAGLITDLAGRWHRTVRAHAVERDVPLAGVAGHALEIAAGAAVLRGAGDPVLRSRVVALAADAADAAGVSDAALADAEAALADGRALAQAERWVQAQGGDPAALHDPALLRQPSLRQPIMAASSGVVRAVDAGAVGVAARWLGAGRLDPDQVIDPSVGVEVVARPGDHVQAGDPVCVVHASDEWLARRGVELLVGAWVIEGA